MPDRTESLKQKPIDNRWLPLCFLYLCFAGWGVLSVLTNHSAIEFLFRVWIASTATTWAIMDARRTGRPLVHIVQFFILITWSVALPIYLAWSRGIRGLGLAFLNAIGLIFVMGLCSGVTWFLVYGI